MIGRDEILPAFAEQVEAIAQGVQTAGADNTVWAIHADLGVDTGALAEAGLAWARLSPVSAAQAGACAEGFMAGFLIALRLARSEA